MSQNRQTPQGPKTKIEPKMESVIQVKLPAVRDYSTGGGHAPGDTLVEGDAKIVTKKWQGYAPINLNVVGKPLPPMAEVAIPKYLGKAEYTSRVVLPNMLHARILTSPHVHARIRNIDTSKAEKMPGVAYILTYKNAPSSYPLPQELNFQGEIVAVAAAETEDLAEDALEAIEIEYEILPSTPTIRDAMSPNAPDLRQGKGNLVLINPNNPHYDPKATWVAKMGDVDRGFAQADIVKEFTYYFGGATAVPIQPVGSLAKWDGDKLTFWGMGQGIYPVRDQIARGLAIDPKNIRYINKYNGCTFGSTNANSRLYPWTAYIAKQVGRPVKMGLSKDQELAMITVKPENIVKFKVGAMRDGRMVAIHHEIHLSMGDQEAAGHSSAEISKNATELYTTKVPNWRSMWYSYKTNTIRAGICRSYTQQEVKWSWENMIDEMAEAVGKDPVEFRLMHVPRPGTKLNKAWHEDLGNRFEAENGEVHYDSYASVEVLQEGQKAIGWDRRNPKAGGNTGRFKRGFGVGMSQHHPGHMGYHDGEVYFEKLAGAATGGGQGIFGSQVEVRADGTILMRNAMPESGTNHDTALAHMVAEMLGFTSRDPVHVIWGDTDAGPPSSTWVAGKTITLQGAAVCSATDKLRKDLLNRAASFLKVDVGKLQLKDGVISATDDPKKRTTFVELVKLNKGVISQQGRGANKDQGRALTKGVAATFVEVEVDTWTGDWKFIRSAYSHDVGLVVNPLVGEADMHGSLVEAFQMTTDPLPYDREFPGTRHYSVGYLSYRLPTIMDVPEQTNIFIDSLEPRWFFGTKSFSETAIGSVPGAISNAIYNACGVRVREHPVTRDKIMAGLKALGGRA